MIYLKPVLILSFLIIGLSVFADKGTPMRRPISPEKPMWLIHIDTWNWSDPQKIISLIPDDIKPYAVMNISLSISHNSETGEKNIVPYGYETAKSWLRACAENQIWATVQCASGGFSHFSETDMTVYEEFYREYPNFIGWNYAEQFWGFDDQFSCSFPERLNHFADLMELSHKYGGYLIISFCGEHYGASLNPVGMMKRDARLKELCREYPEHFMMCEKFTMETCFHDNESVNFGAFASGFAGIYGIRFDVCGWGESSYPEAAGAIPVMEHMMFTGQTVTDGPELIWTQCFKEVNAITTLDGFTSRKWERFPQFDNISIDMFRKILDKSVRILSREEVIDRTKVVIINDITSGNDWDIYASPYTLYEGLYESDGKMNNNKIWTKKTGRYPSIPVVAELADDLAKTFQVQIKKSEYDKRWKTINDKVVEMNSLFPEEYTGDIYASRNDNTWLTYNPYKTETNASGIIPFKYNTAEKIEIGYAPYSMAVINEFSNKLSVYMTNYRTDDTSLKTDTLKIYGCISEPSYSFTDRASHKASNIKSEWKDGIFTLYVSHNGPLDLEINCQGTASDRLTQYKTGNIEVPEKPGVYTGPRQYEAECFDYKNISRNHKNGFNTGVKNYTGQGYMVFGRNTNANIRDTVSVHKKGTYTLKFRYSSPGGNYTTTQLLVNGKRISYLNFAKTATSSDWSIAEKDVILEEGKNVIVLKTSSAASYDLYLDNLVVEAKEDRSIYDFTNDTATEEASDPAATLISVISGSAGVVEYTDSETIKNNAFKTYSKNENGLGVANLDLINPFNTDYIVVWKEYYNTAGDTKGILLRGNNNCSADEALKCGYLFTTKNNNDNTVTLTSYIAGLTGLSVQNSFTSDFKTQAGKPCWYRASAFGNTLSFECSSDSINWIGAENTTYQDNNYIMGTTQLVWGLDSYHGDWVIDNITPLESNISISRLELPNFKTVIHEANPQTQTFNIIAKNLIENVIINVSEGFEISLDEKDFSSNIEISHNSGSIDETTIFVRLNSEQELHDYEGIITVSSHLTNDRIIKLNGKVVPPTSSLIYDFTSDQARTTSSTPPATDITIGTGSSARAGVVSYTDNNNSTSNMLKVYNGGSNSNGTGVMNLDKFEDESTDYSVTWKQYILSSTDSYKNGVVLRGDKDNVGNSSKGYAPGLMTGYVFIAYNNTSAGNTEFRIYTSTESTNLNMKSNNTANIKASVGDPIWYRASVEGVSPTILKLEYSLDNNNWNTVSSYTETNATFKKGSTQFVWGLAAARSGFNLDDIKFDGISYSENMISSIDQITSDNSDIVSTEYFTIMGERVIPGKEELKGFFIVRYHMSDGQTKSEKIYLK